MDLALMHCLNGATGATRDDKCAQVSRQDGKLDRLLITNVISRRHFNLVPLVSETMPSQNWTLANCRVTPSKFTAAAICMNSDSDSSHFALCSALFV